MDILGIEIPSYNESENPMKFAETAIIDWSIDRKDVLALEKTFKSKCKGVKKKRILIKTKRFTSNANDIEKSKMIKLEVKEENETKDWPLKPSDQEFIIDQKGSIVS